LFPWDPPNKFGYQAAPSPRDDVGAEILSLWKLQPKEKHAKTLVSIRPSRPK